MNPLTALCADCAAFDDGSGLRAFCPLHAAAPALLAEVIRLADEWHRDACGNQSSRESCPHSKCLTSSRIIAIAYGEHP